MSDNVRQFALKRAEPNESCVETCKELLVMAESGEMRWIEATYGTTTSVGSKGSGAVPVPNRLMAIEMLKLDLLGVKR